MLTSELGSGNGSGKTPLVDELHVCDKQYLCGRAVMLKPSKGLVLDTELLSGHRYHSRKLIVLPNTRAKTLM